MITSKGIVIDQGEYTCTDIVINKILLFSHFNLKIIRTEFVFLQWQQTLKQLFNDSYYVE